MTGGGRSNSDASRTLTGAGEYTLEISVYGEDISLSELYIIKEPDTESGGKNPQVFTINDLPSEISVSVNVLILFGSDILWKTKKIPTVILSPGDNFVNLEMTKVHSTPESPDNPENPNPEEPGSDEPENPSVKDAEYTVSHMIQKLSEDKASVLNDYEILEEEKFSGKIGEETSASAKNYEGFTAQSFDQKTINENGSTVVEIIYSRNSYKVAFDPNGGSGTVPVPDIETFYGAEFQIPENTFTAASGYKASANTWNTAKDGGGSILKAGEKASSLSSGNGVTVTLFAVWIEKDALSITYYDSDGSIISGMSKTSFKENEDVDLSSVRAEKQGYTFAGWSFTDGGSETTTGWKAGEKTKDVLLYAIWNANTDTKYTVKHLFEGTDGTYAEDQEKTQHLSGTTGEPTAASALSGDDITGFTAQGFEQKTINADGTTVVEIKYERKTVTLTFSYDDGNGGSAQISGKYGTAVTPPATPTKTGYTFKNWSPLVPTTFPAENAAYTATYDANTYTIVFNENGGSGSVDSISAVYGTEVSLPDNTFTAPSGKQKGGTAWNTQGDGNGTGYNAGDKVLNLTAENNGTVTLFAVWVDIPAPAVPAGFVKIDGGTVTESDSQVDDKTPTGPFKSASTASPVTVDSFYLAEAEVTYSRWKDVYDWATTGAGVSKGYVFANLGREGSSGTDGTDVSNGSQPVTNISWRDAIVWCNAASEMENLTPVYKKENSEEPVRRSERGDGSVGTNTSNGNMMSSGEGQAEYATVNHSANGYRLPTDKEWEFAARGGNPSASEWKYKYAGTDSNLADYAVYGLGANGSTSNVKSKSSNSAKLYDMSGNVYEWCYDKSTLTESRVYRGGSYYADATACYVIGTSSSRLTLSPFQMTNQIGFRLARSVIE